VLEFAGRIGLGVDIADFLEFEGAFQRNRVVQATAQEQRVFHAGEVFRPGDHLRLQRQHRLQSGRQVAHGLEVFVFLRLAQAAAHLGQHQREQEQARQLRRERLGGGHADLDAGARDVCQLAFPHHRAGGHVADGQGLGHAQALGVAQRGQRVGGLARLRDGDHQ